MEVIVRGTVIYWFLWLIVRGTGKRSLAQITPLDLVMVVVLGDFVQQGVTEEDMSFTGAIIAVSVFAAWMLLGDALSRRFRRVGSVLGGRPAIVWRDGHMVEEEMEAERIALQDLLEAARASGYADLGQIDIAIMETDGSFSLIPVRSTDEPKRG